MKLQCSSGAVVRALKKKSIAMVIDARSLNDTSSERGVAAEANVETTAGAASAAYAVAPEGLDLEHEEVVGGRAKLALVHYLPRGQDDEFLVLGFPEKNMAEVAMGMLGDTSKNERGAVWAVNLRVDKNRFRLKKVNFSLKIKFKFFFAANKSTKCDATPHLQNFVWRK